MLFNRFFSSALTACGLWLGVYAGSLTGQAPTSKSPATESTRSGFNLPVNERQPDPAQLYGEAMEKAMRSTRATQPSGAVNILHGPASGPVATTTYSSPLGYSNPSSPPEMMIYQEGEFKVVTKNLNDSQTRESFVEGKKVLAEAVQTLRSESSSEEKRADAKKAITKYLEAHFDHDQKKRREQLDSLEAQVVKLKAQLEKRSQSKDQLIELRLTLMENDASGLSFPQSWTQLPGVETYPQPANYPGYPSAGQEEVRYGYVAPRYSTPGVIPNSIPNSNLPPGVIPNSIPAPTAR
jgi:hypothetical protein